MPTLVSCKKQMGILLNHKTTCICRISVIVPNSCFRTLILLLPGWWLLCPNHHVFSSRPPGCVRNPYHLTSGNSHVPPSSSQPDHSSLGTTMGNPFRSIWQISHPLSTVSFSAVTVTWGQQQLETITWNFQEKNS